MPAHATLGQIWNSHPLLPYCTVHSLPGITVMSFLCAQGGLKKEDVTICNLLCTNTLWKVTTIEAHHLPYQTRPAQKLVTLQILV